MLSTTSIPPTANPTSVSKEVIGRNLFWLFPDHSFYPAWMNNWLVAAAHKNASQTGYRYSFWPTSKCHVQKGALNEAKRK